MVIENSPAADCLFRVSLPISIIYYSFFEQAPSGRSCHLAILTFNWVKDLLIKVSALEDVKRVRTIAVAKREIFVLIRFVASCLTAAALIFFISSLSGEDLLENNQKIRNYLHLIGDIEAELGSGIAYRLAQLGEVPDKNPFRKFYSVELAKEIHELSNLTEKQRMLFDEYNVRNFEIQLKRMVAYTETGDIRSLMDELEIVRRELKNSSNLIEKRRDRLIRQRSAYIALFIIFWGTLYLYYSRGIIFKKSEID